MPAQQDELFLCMRKTSDGLYVLHFPFISFSDLHLGSRSSRAKRACMMLGNTSCNRLDGVGDIIDGLHLMKKSRLYMGPWHKQAIAHLLRKAGEGHKLVYMRGRYSSTSTSLLYGALPQSASELAAIGISKQPAAVLVYRTDLAVCP